MMQHRLVRIYEKKITKMRSVAGTHIVLGMHTEPLELTSGVIWTALNIDYPGHSFSHLGMFFG